MSLGTKPNPKTFIKITVQDKNDLRAIKNKIFEKAISSQTLVSESK